MRDDLSEVAQARAWIHLALEKKMLSQHLKELLTNQELLRSEASPFSQADAILFVAFLIESSFPSTGSCINRMRSCSVRKNENSFCSTCCPSTLWTTSVLPTPSPPSVSSVSIYLQKQKEEFTASFYLLWDWSSSSLCSSRVPKCRRCPLRSQVSHIVLSLYPWRSWASPWQLLTPGCACRENWAIQELGRSQRTHRKSFSRFVLLFSEQHAHSRNMFTVRSQKEHCISFNFHTIQTQSWFEHEGRFPRI